MRVVCVCNPAPMLAGSDPLPAPWGDFKKRILSGGASKHAGCVKGSKASYVARKKRVLLPSGCQREVFMICLSAFVKIGMDIDLGGLYGVMIEIFMHNQEIILHE